MSLGSLYVLRFIGLQVFCIVYYMCVDVVFCVHGVCSLVISMTNHPLSMLTLFWLDHQTSKQSSLN